VKNYCTAGQATDDNIIWAMGFECCISKTKDTHSEYTGFANAPQCYIYEHIVLSSFYIIT